MQGLPLKAGAYATFCDTEVGKRFGGGQYVDWGIAASCAAPLLLRFRSARPLPRAREPPSGSPHDSEMPMTVSYSWTPLPTKQHPQPPMVSLFIQARNHHPRHPSRSPFTQRWNGVHIPKSVSQAGMYTSDQVGAEKATTLSRELPTPQREFRFEHVSRIAE